MRSTLGSATITTSGVAPTDTDTVTINGLIYTFKTVLTPTAGEVLINVTAAAALLNLIRAINHTGTPGTDYANLGRTSVVNPDVLADPALTGGSTILTIRTNTGRVGTETTLTKAAATLTLSGAALAGGAADRGARLVQCMLTTVGFLKLGVRGTNPAYAAAVTDIPMAANVPQVFGVPAECVPSAIQQTAGGTLYVIELF